MSSYEDFHFCTLCKMWYKYDPFKYIKHTCTVVLEKGTYKMSKLRETPCKYYVCKGECTKGRDAEQTGYCQTCDKYISRVRERHLNQKKIKIEKLKSKEY